jgi:hypothetical protein
MAPFPRGVTQEWPVSSGSRPANRSVQCLYPFARRDVYVIEIGMTLRASLHAAILDCLNEEGFLPSDFRLEVDTLSQGTKFQLSYQYSIAYFNAEIPDQMSTRVDPTYKEIISYHNIQITARPGRLNISETLSATDDNSLLREIRGWTKRLQADLRHTPVARTVQTHEQLIRELYERIGLTDETDGPLEDDQTKPIVDWVKDLEMKMADNLRQNEKDKKTLEKKIAALHSQVEALLNIVKSQITKKGVIRAIMGRVLNWTSKAENQQLLKDAGVTVARMLASGEKK